MCDVETVEFGAFRLPETFCVSFKRTCVMYSEMDCSVDDHLSSDGTRPLMCSLVLSELAFETGGQLVVDAMPPLAGDDSPVGRIVTDSRQVRPGDVFWALAGPRYDGNHFLEEAFARGAAGVVTHRETLAPWAGGWALRVEDTRWALWQLAAAVRYRFQGSVVGVTGSVGKTTTRQMIHTALAGRLTGTASPQNYNNEIGVPLSMLRWNPLDDYAVVELGANREGEIDALAGLCAPHLGVIPCLAEAHLGKFGSREAIARAKAELLASLPEDGWAVLGGDDPRLRQLGANCRARVVYVGRSGDCDLVATDVQCYGGRLRFRAADVQFELPVWGRHHLTSALAAIAVARIFGLPLVEVRDALRAFRPVAGRCEIFHTAGFTVIDDAYNANPTSMRAALELLRDFDAPGRRVVVCGDMKELGSAAVDRHRQLGEQVVTLCGADLLLAYGDYAGEVVDAAKQAGMPATQAVLACELEEAHATLQNMVVDGDVVLVKGSRDMQLDLLIERLKQSPTLNAA